MAFRRNKEDTRYYFRSQSEEWQENQLPPEETEYPDYAPEAYDQPYEEQDYPDEYGDVPVDEAGNAAYTIDMEGDDLDYLDEAAYHEEKKLRRIGRFRVAAGVLDFLGVIGGMIAVLVLIALLVSLLNWLQADILRSVTILQSWF